MRRKLLAAVFLGVAAAQTVRFERSNPPPTGTVQAPATIDAALRGACYDCHSNETRWPWYSAVAPASWLVHRDVVEGRRRLNFSSWADYALDCGTLVQKLEHLRQRVAAGDMAPWYYRALHPTARWTAAERNEFLHWVDAELAASSPDCRER